MQLIETLLAVLPYWHYKIDRPFKQRHKNAMSLETYYCRYLCNVGNDKSSKI